MVMIAVVSISQLRVSAIAIAVLSLYIGSPIQAASFTAEKSTRPKQAAST